MSVRYDPDRSTRQTASYLAPSSTHAGLVYRVNHDIETDVWRCECPGFTYRQVCRHIRESWELEKQRWYRALWRNSGPEVLADAERGYVERELAGTLTDEDRIAWTELGDVVAARRAA